MKRRIQWSTEEERLFKDERLKLINGDEDIGANRVGACVFGAERTSSDDSDNDADVSAAGQQTNENKHSQPIETSALNWLVLRQSDNTTGIYSSTLIFIFTFFNLFVLVFLLHFKVPPLSPPPRLLFLGSFIPILLLFYFLLPPPFLFPILMFLVSLF